MIAAVCSVIMGVVVYLIYFLTHLILRSNTISTILAILVGGFAYFVLMIVSKGMTEEDLLAFPGGRTLITFARKMRLL